MAETSAWTFVMCHVETDESLEGIFPGDLINRAKKKNLLKDLIYRRYKYDRQSFLDPDKCELQVIRRQ